MTQVVFSKIYLLLLSPFNWILFLIITAFIFEKTKAKKILLNTALVVLLVFGNQVLYNKIMYNWQPPPVSLEGKKYKAAIVLGGITWVEDKQRNFHYFRSASDRFIQPLRMYKQGQVENIIITAGGGGAGFVPNEADFLKDEFLKQGIPASNIFIEKQSATTYENAVFTKKLLDSLQIHDTCVLVTSAIHLTRAEAVFKKAGIPVKAFPCDYDNVNVKQYFTDYFWPEAEVLEKWKYLLKEWVGTINYRAKGYI